MIFVTFFIIFVTMNVQQHIGDFIGRQKRGSLIFASDFRGRGTSGAIKMALSRLAKADKVKRLAHGIYYLPVTDPIFGEILPAPEQIAEEIARKEKIKIKPSGSFALHKLGLSVQVPTRLVYITDGEHRQIKIGNTTIRFKATTPKKLALKGPLSSLIIQALDETDIKGIDTETEQKIKILIKQENPELLALDLKLTTIRIHDYLIKLLNPHDRLVNSHR